MSKKKKKEPNNNPKECSHCGRPGTVSYTLWEKNDPFIRAFETEKKLKFGELVSCPDCSSHWQKLSDPRNKESTYVSLEFIPESSVPKLEEWDSMDLKTTSAQKKILKKIGATPPDAYTNGSEFIRFPCRCVLKDGRNLDMCTLIFRRSMPVFEENENPIFLSDVKEILPSEYTLSKKVRYATSRAEEIRNSYAPTVVRLPTGGKFIFNWTTEFFGTKKIKGSQITEVLNEDPFETKTADEDEMGKSISSQEISIYGHWDDELLEFELNEKNLKD